MQIVLQPVTGSLSGKLTVELSYGEFLTADGINGSGNFVALIGLQKVVVISLKCCRIEKERLGRGDGSHRDRPFSEHTEQGREEVFMAKSIADKRVTYIFTGQPLRIQHEQTAEQIRIHSGIPTERKHGVGIVTEFGITE